MIIADEKCIGCGLCVPYCPMEAISLQEKKAGIDRDSCVECGVCYRVGVCPKDAIERETLTWPRSIRAVFSDPLNIHTETNMAGRGTSEMKTNDVTGRFRQGELGLALEAGRPGVGMRFFEMEKLTKALVTKGFSLEPLNPFTKFVNPDTGEIEPEILGEKVMSAVLEISIPFARLEETLHTLRQIEGELDTVVSVALAAVSDHGTFEYLTGRLEELGYFHRTNGKLNAGLGRPLYHDRVRAEQEGN